jgi:hypothetical protein
MVAYSRVLCQLVCFYHTIIHSVYAVQARLGVSVLPSRRMAKTKKSEENPAPVVDDEDEETLAGGWSSPLQVI